jgi:hypothetical protein
MILAKFCKQNLILNLHFKYLISMNLTDPFRVDKEEECSGRVDDVRREPEAVVVALNQAEVEAITLFC